MPSVSERGVAVRRALTSDVPFIVQLADVAFREYDLQASRTTRLMVESAAITLVAIRGEQAIGFVILQRGSANELSLDAIAVSPSERARGVGQRLLAAAEQYARSVAVGRITLRTAQANVAALDLFLRAGFVITARFARGYRGGQPSCTLEKRLG